MLNLKRFFITAVILVFSLYSCELGNDNDKDNSSLAINEPDPKSYPINQAAFGINTDFDEKTVHYLGEYSEDTMLGVAPANAREHFFSKEKFTSTGVYKILVQRYSDYLIYQNDLSSPSLRNSPPFASYFVFYNQFGTNEIVIDLAREAGGENILRVINPSTSLNISLQLGGVAGRTLGVAPAKYLETSLKVDDGNLNIFPKILRHNKLRDVLEEVFPTNADGSPWYITLSMGDFGNGYVLRDYTLFMRDVLRGLTLSSGMSYIIIDNQVSNGSGVRFLEGGSVHRTLSGLENAMPGIPLTHGITMPTVNNANTTNYAEFRVIQNILVGPAGSEVVLSKGQDDPTPLGSLEIQRDMVYTITVTGDHNQGTLRAWVSSVVKFDVSEFNFD